MPKNQTNPKPSSDEQPSDEGLSVQPLVLPLRVIDLDSPFFFGVGRDMTDEERETAEKHGRYDNPPMSVLGVTREGLAAVEGKELAQLFAAAPQTFAALQELVLLKELKDRIKAGWADDLNAGWADDLNALAAMELEYERRKPKAWDAARAALSRQNADVDLPPRTSPQNKQDAYGG